MTIWARTRLLFCLGLVLAALTFCTTVIGQTEKKERSVKIDFKSGDGVTLVGRYYAPMGKRRDAVVLILHDFSKDKGGTSKGLDYQTLANTLQADGYAVVSFDFRGFGDSTSVDERFWNLANNVRNIRGGVKKPATISYDQFQAIYYRYLINDVAAARAYLERRNDARDLNCSNIIVIGVGQGATIGSAWIYNEARRRQDKTGLIHPLMPPSSMADPESKDIAAAVWVSMSPALAGSNLLRWNYEAVRNQRIPMAFLNGGAKDVTSKQAVATMLARIKPTGGKGVAKAKEPHLELTLQRVLDANLSGEKLLDSDTCVSIRNYLSRVMEDRGAKEWTERDTAKQRSLYTQVGKDRVISVAKPPNMDVPMVDLNIIFGR